MQLGKVNLTRRLKTPDAKQTYIFFFGISEKQQSEKDIHGLLVYADVGAMRDSLLELLCSLYFRCELVPFLAKHLAKTT